MHSPGSVRLARSQRTARRSDVVFSSLDWHGYGPRRVHGRGIMRMYTSPLRLRLSAVSSYTPCALPKASGLFSSDFAGNQPREPMRRDFGGRFRLAQECKGYAKPHQKARLFARHASRRCTPEKADDWTVYVCASTLRCTRNTAIRDASAIVQQADSALWQFGAAAGAGAQHCAADSGHR